MTNAFVGLAGLISPSVLCLMVVGIIFIQVFQVTPQWQAYDDVYKGRYNILGIIIYILLLLSVKTTPKKYLYT